MGYRSSRCLTGGRNDTARGHSHAGWEARVPHRQDAYVLIRDIGVIRGYKSHLIIPRSLFSMNWMISVISSV